VWGVIFQMSNLDHLNSRSRASVLVELTGGASQLEATPPGKVTSNAALARDLVNRSFEETIVAHFRGDGADHGGGKYLE